MKTKIALIISIISSVSCADMKYDKNGKPRATFVGAKASKFVATEQGFYIEGLDTQTGFKDLMDFGGTALGTVVGGSVLKSMSADSIAVDKATVNAGVKTTGMKETTKRIGIKEAAATERAKIHAVPSTALP
jgi:hypothetical protein